MEIDYSHVEEELMFPSKKRTKQVARKLGYLEQKERSQLQRSEDLVPLRGSKQSLWELKLKLSPPLRLLGRFLNLIFVPIYVYEKKRDGAIPQAIVKTADDRTVANCTNNCIHHKI